MSYFEFIMVMLSIIVGLGVSGLLTKVAEQIKTRKTCKAYWLHHIVALTTFIALLQQWWESWDLQVVDSWTFPMVLMMLAGSIGLFIISHLLFPSILKGADLRKHYYEISNNIWGIAVAVVVVSTLFRPLTFGDNLFDWDNASSAGVLIVLTILLFSKNRKVHEILVPILFAAVVLDILVFNLTI